MVGNADAAAQVAMTVAARPKARREAAGRQRRAVPPAGVGVIVSGPQGSIAESAGCRCVVFTAGDGRLRVWGTAFFSPGGLSVNCVGGDGPHIGAVAIGIPRPSLARPGRRSSTTSVFALTGHKEDELARSMASDLARRLGVTAVVVAGVHVARATPSDIAAVLRNAGDAVRAILASAAPTRRQGRRRP
jgi:hypothetical protein